MSLATALFIASLSILYAYHTHITTAQERNRRRSRDAEYPFLVRENEGLRLQLTLLTRRNEEIELRLADYEASAIISSSILAEQAQENVQLQARLKSMETERNSKNVTIEKNRKAAADQSREISRLSGELASAESRCRWKDEQIRTMGKDHETVNAVCVRYESQVLELSDKLSECHSLLSRTARTGDWIKAAALQSSLPPAYQESTGRRRVPTRKPSRPATDPNKSRFDSHILDDSPFFQ